MTPLTNARRATQCHFFASGLLFATWGVNIPAIKAHFGLSEAALSWLMLSAGVGTLLGLSRVGRWVGQHGARQVVLLGGAGIVAPLAVLLWLPGFGALLAALFVFGLASGAFDVAINAEAVAIEHASRRPVMSSFHGFFSLGGMAGAGIGGAFAAFGLSAPRHLACLAVAGMLAISLASRFMLPTEPPEQTAPSNGWRRPPTQMLLLGLLAALGLLGEGAMYDWSTLYMEKSLGSPHAQATLAYGSFSAAMAITRFGGDWIRTHVSSSRLLEVAGALAALAMTLTLWTSHPWVAIAGFGLAGIGFANVIPLLFTAAARLPGISPARGIAGVSGCGYLGLMAGPPLIGMLANDFGLRKALWLVVIGAMLVTLLTRPALHQHAPTP